MNTQFEIIEEEQYITKFQKNNEFNFDDYLSFEQNLKQMEGPDNTSNWLVPNAIAMGPYPSNRLIKNLKSQGFKLFVNLIGESWGDEQDADYHENEVDFIRFKIHDFSTSSDEKTLELIQTLVKKYQEGNKMYIHCMGGHGRTGIITISLFMALYGVDFKEAYRLVNLFHLQRKYCCRFSKLPECNKQKKQIQRMESNLKEIHVNFKKQKEKEVLSELKKKEDNEIFQLKKEKPSDKWAWICSEEEYEINGIIWSVNQDPSTFEWTPIEYSTAGFLEGVYTQKQAQFNPSLPIDVNMNQIQYKIFLNDIWKGCVVNQDGSHGEQIYIRRVSK